MQQYAVYARIKGSNSEYQMVTLNGQIFFGDKGLIELCIEKALDKHPTWELIVQEVLMQ